MELIEWECINPTKLGLGNIVGSDGREIRFDFIFKKRKIKKSTKKAERKD